MLKIVLGAVFALSSTAAAVADDTVVWQDNIEGWTVIVDRTINDSCFIISGFDDNLLVRFQFNSTQRNVQLILANTQWKSLKSGESYNLDVAFGQYEAWNGTATAHRWHEVLPSLVLSVPAAGEQAADFMAEFRTTASVQISHNGLEIADVPLDGADAAISSMLECQAAMTTQRDIKSSPPRPNGGSDLT